MMKTPGMFKLAAIATGLFFAVRIIGAEQIPAEKWTIATGGSKNTTALFCAQELQELLSARIGKKLPVATDAELPASPVILLDKTDPALGAEGFRIVRENNVIRIIGGTPLGTLYGVYEFLQRFCDVWNVAPGVVYAPRNRPLNFGEMDLKMKPAFGKREIYHTGGDYTVPATKIKWRVFDLRNRNSLALINPQYKAFNQCTDTRYLVSRNAGNGCHSFYDYVPPGKYGKTHPEYFTMNKEGVRVMIKDGGGQLCLSNPDVKKIVYEHLLTSIEKDRKQFGEHYPRVYDFSQMDNAYVLCVCPECKKITARYGNRESGLLLWFINQIARDIRKKYPDVLIRTMAYVNTEMPPEGIRAEDNVIIQLCDLYSKCNHTLPLTHPVNAERRRLVEAWAKQAKHLTIWDYILQTGNEPLVPVDAIAPDAKLFRSSGVESIFMETEIHVDNPSSFEYLKDFVLGQMYFNPDQDLEKLLDVFCRGFFGPVHKEMKAYLDYLRQAQKEKPTADMNAWHIRTLDHLTLNFLHKGKAMVQKAMAKNKDPEIALRLLWEMNVLDNALIRGMAPYPKLAGERKALMKNQLGNRLKILNSYGLSEYRRKQLENAIRLPIEDSLVVFTDLPEELKDMPPDSIRYLGVTRQFRGGSTCHYEQDPDSKLSRVLVWQTSNPAGYKPVIGCGIYDTLRKKAFGARVKAADDEKYHWYKIVRFTMGPASYFYALNWHPQFNLRGLFIISDGVDEKNDPNLYEIWVSIKFRGPAYKKDSTQPNGILFERAILVPVSKLK